LFWLVALYVLNAAAAQAREPFVTRPDESVLLFGDKTVASTSYLSQKFFPAARHPANPVMKKGEAWEGVGPYVFGSRLMQDRESRLFRLWYVTYSFEGNFYRWGYATSPDGLSWTRPDLKLERYRDQPAGNLLPLGPYAEKGARSIARDPRPGTPADRRYLGVRFTYDGELVSFSPDGLHWVEYAKNPVWHVPSDIIHVMWDERRQKFIAFFKDWELTGREIRPDAPQGTPFTAYMPYFTPKDLGNGTTEFDGPCVVYRPPGAAGVTKRKFILKSGNQSADDGGGVSLSGEWSAKRVQVFAESEDGIHWMNEQVVLRSDTKDPPTANIQYMFVVPYGGYYVGFPTLHDESGLFNLQLAWSADGIKWHRPSRTPWLAPGPTGSFDCGMVLGPADPIIGEREMWFPYGGFPIRHDSKETNWQSAIGLATIRLDGFAAWQAGDEAGELVTRPFRCDGDWLFVNADSQNGSLQVEALNEHGATVAGFYMDDCRNVSTDTLADKDSGWIHWKGERNLRKLKGQTIQLRFKLKNAQLYSFRVADENARELPVPRATDR
jgi:hypothetical protein